MVATGDSVGLRSNIGGRTVLEESKSSAAVMAAARPPLSSAARPISESQILDALKAVANTHPTPGYVREENLYGGTLETVRLVLRNVRPGARILDFGAGGADKTCALARLGYEMHAYDDLQDPWHLKDDNWRRLISFAASHGVQYLRAEPGVPWPYEPETFDMIMLDNVIEHLHDSPRELLVSLRELIKPGGVLFISVPNAGNLRKRLAVLMGGTNMARYDYFYWKEGSWRGHVREYVRGDIESLARYLNLTPMEIGGFDSLIGRLSKRQRMIWKFVTAIIPNGADSWKLVGRKEPGSQPMRQPPDERGLLRLLKRNEA